ncbi:MAG: hypothetical protein IT581_16105 [Verrucomicrobiales bacterium]|nr:hypothetical protein [Verrucomicrobiales bacterium]
MNSRPFLYSSLKCKAACVAGLAVASASYSQEVLLREGFNDDGEATNPKRYTMTGRDLFEPDRIRAELSNFDQKGPIYWEHSFKVSYTGNPEIPARRAIFTWRGVDGTAANEDLMKLFDSTINWLLAGKKNAQIVVNPNAASIQGLADRLAAAGHTVSDDDTTANPNEADVPGDLFIHGPGANNASRFVLVPKPVLVMNAPDYDDMLVGSIGTAATFDPGNITITDATHPAAGGKTGSFTGFVAPQQAFELKGSFLPPSAKTIATVTRVVPPAVNNLGDVDAMVAGTKTHEQTAGTADQIDFSDASAGQWFIDNPLPGGYTGNWGVVVTGKITVGTAGTYRFAVGSDDGARLQIDRDKNGFTTADNVIEDAGPHAHQIAYANVAFDAAGTYDLRVVSYNSAGGGSLEVSVANAAGEVPDDNLDSGYWEVLGASDGISPVKLTGTAAVTAYRATGPNVEQQEPLIITLNGPADNPPGGFYDGGRFTNFEGAGFLGGSGMNKWAYPDGQSYRSVRLNPVSVAGKTNVHLTVALAATVVDFEDSDFIDVVVYPKGANSSPVTLAHFRGVQNAIQPWLADEKQGFTRRLTKEFADFTYDVPAGATDLVIEIRVASTWWTEILAVDNVRVTAGSANTAVGPIAIAHAADKVQVSWPQGQTAKLESATSAAGPWTEVSGAANPHSVTPSAAGAFYRLRQ